MDEHDWLVARFEAERPQLQAMAYRMLGSLSEAEDAVQESWLHLVRVDTNAIKNPGAWLTRAVARICMDLHGYAAHTQSAARGAPGRVRARIHYQST
jgi:DNA-directed RNA polymerase specialized sigma24 family protein